MPMLDRPATINTIRAGTRTAGRHAAVAKQHAPTTSRAMVMIQRSVAPRPASPVIVLPSGL
jgi:hypothetical protein